MTKRWQLARELPLLTLLLLLLAAVIAQSAHHVVQAPAFTSSTDHLGVLCLIALHQVLSPVHYGFHALLLMGVAYAVWDRSRAWRQSRTLLGFLDTDPETLPPKLREAAAGAAVPYALVRVIPGLPVPAFTAGWLRPRIYVASEAVTLLAGPELAAVLAHEHHHVRQRDPLRLFALRFVGAVLFWLPVGRTLARVAADNAELAADDAAAVLVGRTPLASALIRLTQRFTRSAPAWSVPFQSPRFLEYRVRRLLGVALPTARVSSTTASVVLAASVVLLAGLSGALMAHPLEGNRTHCAHREQSPFGHLMCGRGDVSRDGSCPHSTSRDQHHHR